MPEHTTAIERNIAPKLGARFFRDGDAGAEVQFEFVIDPNNVLGPRTATPADRQAHPEAWRHFEVHGQPPVVAEAVEPVAVEAAPAQPAAPKKVAKTVAKPKRAYTRRKAS